MEYKWKFKVTMLAAIFSVSCSESGSKLSEVIPDERSAEFLGGGSCSEQVLFNEAIGLPASVTSSDNYFECGDGELELLISSAPGSMPTGSGSVTFNGETIPTDSVGVEFYFGNEYENHQGIQLYLHNGEIRQAEKRFEQFDDTGAGIYRHEVRHGIYSATYVLSVELGSVAPDKFEVGIFEYTGGIEDPNDPLYANANVMFNAIAFFDASENGVIDSLEEILDVESGHVTISGERPEWSITVDVLLSNGDVLTGQYFGDLVEISLAEEYLP